MDSPRIPAAYPKTPKPAHPRGPERDNGFTPPPAATLASPKPISDITAVRTNQPSGPDPNTASYIPENVIDAPTQRLYACAVWVLLQAYKLYDIGILYSSEGDAVSELWFILKWVFIDGVFLRTLPLLRIRWLTFSPSTTLLQILSISAANIFFCLRYQDVFVLILTSFWKQIFTHELGLSQRRVKVRDLVSSNSHILGKHTVHYLPEGSAALNPSNLHLCFNAVEKEGAFLPIMVNSSMPSLIQLSITSFEKSEPTILNITQKEIKRLVKTSPTKSGESKIHQLNFPIKSPGLYRLEKVVDVSQLVVRVRKSELLVVSCPTANFGGGTTIHPGLDKCKGELTDLTLEVVGLPPLQVRYGRSINRDGKDVTIQSISPIGYDSPLLHSSRDDGPRQLLANQNLSWAKPQKVSISLNESLASQGSWIYGIDEVVDGLGNSVKFILKENTVDPQILRRFSVHERPLVRYTSCSPQNPLLVARGKSGALPLEIVRDKDAAPYEITYSFNPYTGGDSGQASDSEIRSVSLKSSGQPIAAGAPGLYSLKSITSRFCAGEVLEPSTCLLLSPPDPNLSISFDEIVDRCAGSSIGLTIDMKLEGSPPFKVYYRTIKDEKEKTINAITVSGTRHQLRLTPSAAGHYMYEFYSIDDQVYDGVALDPRKLSVKQRIIPMAGALFVPSSSSRRCCIGESATFTVDMQGSGPWTLEYELAHAGKRTKFKDANITTTPHLITTPKLVSGGEHTVALTTVEDSHGCKVFLGSEARVDVRRQRPSVSFAEIDGSRTMNTLEAESVSLPLRLIGEKPFRVKYRHKDESGHSSDHDIVAKDFNSNLQVYRRGTYELIAIHDSICPGSVSEKGNTFDVNWIARPSAFIVQSPSFTAKGDVFTRNPVCEGDEDTVELRLEGKPPFIANFDQSSTIERSGQKSLRSLEVKAGTPRASLRMDTSKSGVYRYTLKQLADSVYTRLAPPVSPLIIEQTVNARPSARFKSPGKVHKYCLEAGTGEDSIPIILDGVAPFILSVGVKHYSTGKEEIINIPNIDSTSHIFRVPSHVLTLGGHVVRIHKVRDSRGCAQKYGHELPHVSVAVADLPSLTSLDPKPYYCVGDRISYSVAGAPPFTLEYTFAGKKEKVSTSSSFQRIAERAGTLTFNSLKDSASDCNVDLNISKVIHDIPTVRVSEGGQVIEGIHQGEQVEIHFQLQGTAPFTFTYIRSDIPKKGAKPKILEMHTQTTNDNKHTIIASLEGTYEVVSIHDKYCGYSSPKSQEFSSPNQRLDYHN